MTAETATILVAAIAPTLTALAAFIVTIRNGRRSVDRGIKAEATAAKVETIKAVVTTNDETTNKIHANLADVQTALGVAHTRIEKLERLIDKVK